MGVGDTGYGTYPGNFKGWLIKNLADSDGDIDLTNAPEKKSPTTFSCQYCNSKYVRPTEGKIQCPGCGAPPSDEDIYMAGFNDGFDYGKIDTSDGQFHSKEKNQFGFYSSDGVAFASTDMNLSYST